ncbi:MAG TPA: chromate efflux transporter [Thermoanaerobaculia bacterium]|nr:chromate efflux transporter [Thermoanaerobaculia bacterium]
MNRKDAPSVGAISLYFLRLGTVGFGGPIALANAMRSDLVEKRRWLDEAEYAEGLAIASACPGPLAYQLGIYVGLVLRGVPGALAAAVSFALVPFLVAAGAAAAYVKFGASGTVRALFYGIAPVVLGLIVKACLSLAKKTIGRDPRAVLLAVIAGAVTATSGKEPTLLLLLAGVLGAFAFASRPVTVEGPPSPPPSGSEPPAPPSVLATAFFGSITASPLGTLFLFFLKTGFLVFGSGLVIVPFLKASVVDRYHWLSEQAFLDSVAIGMITPGPVVITATFVGYLLAGFPGATAATLGIFAPPVLMTVVATPLLRRFRANTRVRGFITGLTVAVIGVLLGTVFLVGRSAISDPLTAAVAVVALVVLIAFPKIPEPLLVLAGAVAGLLARGAG